MTGEHTSWVTDIANYLRSANFMDGQCTAYQMGESVQGCVVAPPLQGLRMERTMGSYYRGEYEVVVRTSDLSNAHFLASQVIQLLTLDNVTLGGCKIVTSYAEATPAVYPRDDGDLFEASVWFQLALIDDRIYQAPGSSVSIAPTGEIRVFYDPARDSIFITASPIPWPDRSLVAVQSGDLVSIMVANINAPVVAPTNYQVYRDRDGNSFASAAEVVQYLQAEFSKDDRDVATGLTVTWNQTIAADVWNIPHNFGVNPAAISVYVGGDLVQAQIHVVDQNTIQIGFASPCIGQAILKQ